MLGGTPWPMLSPTCTAGLRQNLQDSLCDMYVEKRSGAMVPVMGVFFVGSCAFPTRCIVHRDIKLQNYLLQEACGPCCLATRLAIRDVPPKLAYRAQTCERNSLVDKRNQTNIRSNYPPFATLNSLNIEINWLRAKTQPVRSLSVR